MTENQTPDVAPEIQVHEVEPQIQAETPSVEQPQATMNVVRDEAEASTGPQPPEDSQAEETKLTMNEKIQVILEEVCASQNIQMRDIANAMSQSLQRQIRLQEKERDLFKSAQEQHINKVQYKELLAREITAQGIVDKHQSEMKIYQERLINGVNSRLVQLATTPEQKHIADEVAKMFGLDVNLIEKEIEHEIDKRASVRADNMFNSLVANQNKSKKKGWF